MNLLTLELKEMKTKISLREQRLSTHQVVSYFSLNNVKKHLSILALTIFLPVSNGLHLDVSTRPETKANLFMSRLSARPFHIFFLWSPAGFYFCQSFSAVGPITCSSCLLLSWCLASQTVLTRLFFRCVLTGGLVDISSSASFGVLSALSSCRLPL